MLFQVSHLQHPPTSSNITICARVKPWHMDDHPARTGNQGVVDAGGPGPMVLSNAVAMGRLVVPCTQGLLAKRFFFRHNSASRSEL